ncbi:MAG TPA: trigger factor [Actinobacteria bacterium]|nr:trigger factor [bacterium BMS3Bbin01]HDH27401.1 trigger factor [Actinomycetota bacterium]
MNTKVTDLGPFEKLMTLEVSGETLLAAENRAARKLSREVKIKGFRPGHAPRRVVESVVGAQRLRSDAIDDLLPAMVAEALNESELVPALNPSVDEIVDVDDGVEVQIKVTLWPELDIVPEFRDREIEVNIPDVDEEELRSQIDRMRDQFSELETVDRPVVEGDFVAIDLSASLDGEPIEDAAATDLLLETGSGSFIEGIDEQLIGKKAGDIVAFDGPLPAGFGDRAGEQVTFRVLVKEVKEKRLPDLTDEWVSDVTEFETVEEMRSDLEQRMTEIKRAGSMAQLRNGILEQLLDEMELEIPEGIIGAEMDAILHRFAHEIEGQGISLDDYLQVTGQDQEAFVDDLRSRADRNVRTDILLNSIAKAEGIEVSEEEVAEVVDPLARQAGREPEEFRAELGEQENAVRGDILRRKALEMLVNAVVPIDQNGSRIVLIAEETKDDDQPAEETE